LIPASAYDFAGSPADRAEGAAVVGPHLGSGDFNRGAHETGFQGERIAEIHRMENL